MYKKTIFTAMAAAACVAANAMPTWGTSNAKLTREGDLIAVGLTFDLTDTDMPSDRALVITPCIASDTDTVVLPSVGIYGRNRYHYYQRRSPHMITGADEWVIKSSQRPSTLDYKQTIAYSNSLNDCRLILKSTTYGCCAKPIEQLVATTDATYRAYRPWQIQPVYVAAKTVGAKTESLADRAYIAFAVNRTEIQPDFRDNYAELCKIRKSIDQVIDDPDCTLTGIWLKGYASPEGRYDHNSELAKRRTEALKEYIRCLYGYPSTTIAAEYEPEDWDGLRHYVASSNIDNRDGVLSIIERQMDPDQKEYLLKKTYPADFAFLLLHAYPQLRHTDYRIDYTIRRFTDVDEIRRIYATQPHKLDLNELYQLADSYTAGTPEFNDVYQTAARMYPADETANLNAANAALQSGNIQAAADCLMRAGQSNEAQYTRGILALLNGDHDTADQLLRAASNAGIAGADDLLRQMDYNLNR